MGDLIPVLENIFQIEIDLSSEGSLWASLNELEVYVREDPESVVQTPYDNAAGSVWIHSEEDNMDMFEFDEVCDKTTK